MKTKVEIEIGDYEIKIEEIDGVISVKAEKDDEIVEEFSIEVEESEEGEFEGEEGLEGEDIKGFGEFGGEEEDFEGEESEEGEFEGEEMEDEMEEGEAPALESFQSFINKRK